jgi:geranylgeranyl pyrophosphate synthase
MSARLLLMKLNQALEEVQEILQPEIQQLFAKYLARVEPIDTWSVQVIENLQEYCLRPGKATRPLLVAVGAALAQGISLEEAWQKQVVRHAMLIVQLKHKHWLILDDIADQDEMRNGLPALHIKWENELKTQPTYQDLSPARIKHLARSYTEIAAAQLSGIAYWLMFDPVLPPSVQREFTEVVQDRIYDRTTTGWYMIFDQSTETLSDQTSEEKLLKGLELVSGEYSFVAPLKIGALLEPKLNTKATKLDQALLDYGRAAGVLFQITDDIIGAFGDPAITGKPVGGDFREGKKTLLVQYAYRHGNQSQRQYLQQIIGQESISTQEVEKVQAIMLETGALDYAKQRASDYMNQAQQSLAVLPESAEKKLLINFVELILERKK